MKKVDTRRMQAAEMKMIRTILERCFVIKFRMVCWGIEQE